MNLRNSSECACVYVYMYVYMYLCVLYILLTMCKMILRNLPALQVLSPIGPCHKNRARNAAHTIGSRPEPKQWITVHTSD